MKTPTRSRIERVAALAAELAKVAQWSSDTNYIAFLNQTLDTIGCSLKVVEKK